MSAKPEASARKRPYSAPTLSKYGDLAQMTTAASKSAKLMDGGNNAFKSN